MARPLQNRVTPSGAIEATAHRGTLMGNRGGRFHRPDQTLTKSRFKSKAWIICLLAYKGWHRKVMSDGYTELFFLDEATALAAGHRPCFLCQRTRAKAFCAAAGHTRAPALDTCLHMERRARPLMIPMQDAAVTGAMIAIGGAPFLVAQNALLRWSHGGYIDRRPHPKGKVILLTPPTTLTALKSGFTPALHVSAAAFSA